MKPKHASLLLIVMLLFSGFSLITILFVHAAPSITYSFPTITISGFTVGTQCTSWDVWNASNSNGWQVVNVTGTSDRYQFSFLVDIVITDGYFRDTNVDLFFNTTYAGVRDRIEVQNGANLSLGTLVDPITKRTTDGVNIIAGASSGGGLIDIKSGGVVELYGSHLITLDVDTIEIGGNLTAYETSFTNLGFSGIGANTNIDVYRVNMEGSTSGISNPTTSTTFDDLLIHSMAEAMVMSGSTTSTFSNLIGRNNTKTVRTAFWSGALYLIDADIDVWAFTWLISPNGEVYRQYSFGLTVTTAANVPIEDVNVTLTYFGEGGGTHGTWLTNALGQIPQQTVTAGFYNQTGGDTIYSYNPYEIKITKDGYLTYQRNFTQLEAKSWNIALLTTSAVTFDSTYYLLGIVTFMPLLLIIGVWRKKRKNGS